MSSILKALRKIENEKRVDKCAAPDLMSDQGFAAVKSKPMLSLMAGIALGAAIVALLFLWVPRETAPAVNAPPLSRPEQASITAENGQGEPRGILEEKTIEARATPSTSGHSLKDSTESGMMPVVTLPHDALAATENRKSTALKPAVKLSANQKPLPGTAMIVSSPALAIPPPQEALAIDTTSNSPSALPDGVFLSVSEIYYQEEIANSMAVVNDLPVMVGTTVDSAVVNEIRPDRVVFEINGMTYSVEQSRP